MYVAEGGSWLSNGESLIRVLAGSMRLGVDRLKVDRDVGDRVMFPMSTRVFRMRVTECRE